MLLVVFASVLMAVVNLLLPRLTAPKLTTIVSYGTDESGCYGVMKDGKTPMIGFCIEPSRELATAVEERDIKARFSSSKGGRFYLEGQRIWPREDGMRLLVFGPHEEWQELFIDKQELDQFIDDQGYFYDPKGFFDRYLNIAFEAHD